MFSVGNVGVTKPKVPKWPSCEVKWFNKELERLMKSYVLSGVPAQYVKDKLLHQAVTGAKYRENRMTHRFRRALKSPKEEEHALEEVSGFWKIEKLAGYLPPWEAYHTFGFYQDFYLVQWQRPFSDVDYSRTVFQWLHTLKRKKH